MNDPHDPRPYLVLDLEPRKANAPAAVWGFITLEAIHWMVHHGLNAGDLERGRLLSALENRPPWSNTARNALEAFNKGLEP